MESCLRFEICNDNVHRASMQKHIRSKKLLKNEKVKDIVIPEWLNGCLKKSKHLFQLKLKKHVTLKH